MSKKELSFKEGYGVLKKNAELLESQEEPDIDNLMKIVEESMVAYKGKRPLNTPYEFIL